MTGGGVGAPGEDKQKGSGGPPSLTGPGGTGGFGPGGFGGRGGQTGGGTPQVQYLRIRQQAIFTLEQ